MQNLPKKTEIWASYICFAILGISGVLANHLTAHFYGASGVGIFNQIFSFYIVFSQLAVFGIHLSVQRILPTVMDSKDSAKEQVLSALLAASGFSAISTLFMVVLAPWLSRWMSSPELESGLISAAIGLFFFGMNKVLLAVLNGASKNLIFFILQSLRMVLILAGVVIVGRGGYSSGTLGWSFTIAETLVFLFAAFSARSFLYQKWNSTRLAAHAKSHLRFGFQALPSNIFTEMNSRVDVIILGFFFSDARVGIYSFIATIAEGVYHLCIFQRALYNPKLASLFHRGNTSEFKTLIFFGARKHYFTYAAVFLAAICIYPYARPLIDPANLFSETPALLAYLLVGMYLASGFTPFHMAFVQMNKPLVYTLFMVLVLAGNIAVNLAIVPIYEVPGAAVATGLSYALTVPVFLYLLKKSLKKSAKNT
jgi:O-antigen/teichoic acid export membrane protein